MSWSDDARCAGADVNLFFPVPREGLSADSRPALAICNRCPVVTDCLAEAFRWAAETPEGYCAWFQGGIVGGTTPTMRRKVKPAAMREMTPDRLAAILRHPSNYNP